MAYSNGNRYEVPALYVHDLRAARSEPGTVRSGAVNRNGRSVVFTSTADDLVPGDTNGVPDVFIDHIH